MADQSIRTAVEGISPPEKEKHQFFLDVQPVSVTSLFYMKNAFVNL